MSESTSLEPPTPRLDRLERELRRWRFISIAALAGLSIVVLVAATAPAPKEIRAMRFVVVDDTDTKRAELGFKRATAPVPAPEMNLELVGLSLYGPTNNTLVSLSALLASTPGNTPSSTVALKLYDPQADVAAAPRVVVGSTTYMDGPRGKPTERPLASLSLFDKTGTLVWKAP
jgi:hypothetical protein